MLQLRNRCGVKLFDSKHGIQIQMKMMQLGHSSDFVCSLVPSLFSLRGVSALLNLSCRQRQECSYPVRKRVPVPSMPVDRCASWC